MERVSFRDSAFTGRKDHLILFPIPVLSGIPSSTGFVKVGYAGGSTTTSFVDNDNGQGLQFGKEYTYRIVAVYPNGTESKISNEITSTPGIWCSGNKKCQRTKN